jgi:hypothetical protein
MNQPFSEEIISEVDRLSGGKLNFRDDIESFIRIAAEEGKMETLKEISFYAKFLKSILSILQRKDEIIDGNYLNKAAGEYKTNLRKISGLINELLGNGNAFLKGILNEKYFKLSVESLRNLNLLCSDLSYLKLYFNDRRNSAE